MALFNYAEAKTESSILTYEGVVKMKNIDYRLLELMGKETLSKQVFKGNYGLEKENVRVDSAGKLALTPHPRAFGDKLQNPYIKTDFSESQIEIVTPVCQSLEEVYAILENIQDVVSTTLEGEYLWPQSNPPILPADEQIPIAIYDDNGINERKYRERLAEKYGRRRQLLSGIHFNFSFNEDFLQELYQELGGNQSYQDFKDKLYLKIIRNFLKYRWLLIYLTGASPVFHSTLDERLNAISKQIGRESYHCYDLNSLRNSQCGYKNEEDFIINYDSLEAYTNSIQALIDGGKIASTSEFYSTIRLKGNPKGPLEQLKAEGIKYVELRLFDLNPFDKNGIALEDLYLTNLFLVYLLLLEDQVFDAKQQEISHKNQDLVTVSGGQADAKIYNDAGELVSLRDTAINIIDDLRAIVQTLKYKEDYLATVVEVARAKILDPRQTYAHRIVEQVKDKSYIAFHLAKAKEYAQASGRKLNLTGYEDMELSTQILMRDAIRRGITVEILDRGEDFLRMSKGDRVEYVKQATKTSKDAYSTVLIMENKVVTKQVLQEHGLRVPASESFANPEEAKLTFQRLKANQIVIKPKSTNFGLGISIFKDGFTKEQFERAINIAFSHDQTILIEDFVAGQEYRFLVIGNEVVAVLHRVPANVRGDGTSSIKDLVTIKNQDPLRGTGHKTPLEKIVQGEIEELFLKNQGKDFDYIPSPGEVVFLRENSNISTGGDSIDYTHRVHGSYQRLAVQAAKAVGAAITGVDIIIEDVTKHQNETNYAIIELNFNPAMYMHCYPYEGENRRVGEKILDLLFGG